MLRARKARRLVAFLASLHCVSKYKKVGTQSWTRLLFSSLVLCGVLTAKSTILDVKLEGDLNSTQEININIHCWKQESVTYFRCLCVSGDKNSLIGERTEKGIIFIYLFILNESSLASGLLLVLHQNCQQLFHLFSWRMPKEIFSSLSHHQNSWRYTSVPAW